MTENTEGPGHVEETETAQLGLSILDVKITVSSRVKAVELLDQRIKAGLLSRVAFANAHLLNLAFKDVRLRRALESFLVFNDGIGVDIGAKVLHGVKFPDNLNGTDFIPDYLERTSCAHRIFLIGARPLSVAKSAQFVRSRFPRHRVVGWRDGYSGLNDPVDLIERIRGSKATMLLVALGNPRQELWLAEWSEQSGAAIGFGVGGLFDFWSGAARRAPQLVRRARCEWLYRLACEPRRLARRYLIGNPLFLVRVGSNLVKSASQRQRRSRQRRTG